MGCGASASKKRPVPEVSKLKDARTKSGESLDSKKGLHRAQSDVELHRKECTEDDMGQVFTIQQAFPTVDAAGRRHSCSSLPEELVCTTCSRFLVSDLQEKEFFACRKCWMAGRRFVQCTSCYMAAGAQEASRSCRPMSPKMQRRRSSGNLEKSKSMDASYLSTRRLSHATNASVSVQLQRRGSEASIETEDGSSDEETRPQGPPVEVQEPLKQRRNSQSQALSRGRRRSSTREISLPRRRSEVHPQRRQSTDDGLVTKSTSMLAMFDWTKLSGTWDVEIREEGSKTRKEQRLLTFSDSGSITGTGNSGCVSLDGRATGLNMEWLEVHPWGSMHVTAKYKAKTKRLHGTFKASDGGKGKIDMSHRLD
mmetsp:Transcript_37270/g.87471  ORF Transcript_37270/g.87471 Transcript_37270/m.87471 type:complete len:367 (+) Transcript_37270:22-1122(+)